MSKSGPGAKHLPTNKKTTAEYMTPPTLAGKKGVESMGVPKPTEKDYSKRSAVEKVEESPEKISTYPLNKNSMSKSLFEKLFEDVMDGADFSKPTDEETLGIESGEDLGGDEDLGGGEDEVTFTLDRATAEKLHAALGTILGGSEEAGEGEEEAGEEFGEEGGEEAGEEEEEFGDDAFGEGIEIVAEPQKLSTSYKDGKNNKEIHGSKLTKSQGGAAKSGDIPEAKGNPQALGDKSKALQSKSNKVQGFTTKGSMFDL